MTAPSTRCGGPFAAVGRFSYRHRRWVLAVWVVVLAAGLLFGTKVFDTAAPAAKAAGSESATGSALLAAADPTSGGITAVVEGKPVADPAVRAAVTAAAVDLSRIPGVGQVTEASSGQGTASRRSHDSGDTLSEVDVTRIFGDALSALPPATRRFTLYFRFKSD